MSIKVTSKADEHAIPVIAQIVAAFATLAAIILIFAVSVFLAFDRIEHNIEVLALNTVPILDDIGTIQENMSIIQISVLRHMLAAGADDKQLEEQTIANSYAANSALLQRKGDLALTPEEEEMYARVLKSRATYAELWQRQLELSRTGSAGEAIRFNKEKLLPAYDAYQKVLNMISVYIKTETKKRVSRVFDYMEAVQSFCNFLFVAGLCIAAGMGLVIIRVTQKLHANNRLLAAEIAQRKQAEQHLERLVLELKDALDNIKQLSGLLPICASCKKIRNDQGYWQRIETYISDHSEAQFTHGLCPECSKKLYPNTRDDEGHDKR